ncbi:hypothetical protein [Prosthecobacter vanneervenii]|uniref:Uncharacterized protein n=1 Tax=Prosthecobacter vanneervenii TaxID=48466 RepID=A0A7W8DML4_9BACT|nr:hypothetical protein [Prosthecobacter vanneervenii]MBB5035478.1 hypothetical protein [Prosthecobacter vanneervenii]
MRLRLLLILSALLLRLTTPATATEQEDDFILYRGERCALETHWLFPAPLQAYFADGKHGEYPLKMVSTANYRGHVATYEIADGRLYLAKIEPSAMVRMVELSLPNASKKTGEAAVAAAVKKEQARLDETLRQIFPGRAAADGRIFADWYSGQLRIFCTLKKTKFQHPDEKTPHEEIMPTEVALLKIKEGAVVKETRFPLEEYWTKFEIMQRRREIPDEEAAAITDHLEFLDSYSRNWNKIPGVDDAKGPLRTEADFSVFLTRQVDARVRIPLTKFVLVKDTALMPYDSKHWTGDEDLRIKPGAHLLMLEMGASNVPIGPWSPYAGGAVQVLAQVGALKTGKITFTQEDLEKVRMINNYDHQDDTLLKLDGDLQMDVAADGKVQLTGAVRLTSKDPTTYQEIALDKTEIPVLTLQDYLKKQERESEIYKLFQKTAEKVYQEVLEKSKTSPEKKTPGKSAK